MAREILSIAAIAVIMGLYVRETIRWRLNPQGISRSQMNLRTVSVIILMGILLMIFAGDNWFGGMLIDRIAYWLICLLLTVALIIIAMIDIHMVLKSMNNEAHNMVKTLLKSDDISNKTSETDLDDNHPPKQ